MTQHNAKAIRRRDGMYRWWASCPCGWRARADRGREDATALAKRHNIENARALFLHYGNPGGQS